MMIMKIFLKTLWVIENKQAPEIKLYLVEINLLNKYTKINRPKISFLKLVPAIFYQFFICSPNYRPFKTMKNVFYLV